MKEEVSVKLSAIDYLLLFTFLLIIGAEIVVALLPFYLKHA